MLLLCVAAITLPVKGKRKGGEDFFFPFGMGLNLFGNLYSLMVAVFFCEGRLFLVSVPVIYSIFSDTLCI